ncbi:MAG: TetR/AcrR family transcriptional regulator [Candidatus Binatia bacterium]
MPRAANPTLRADILKAALRLVEEDGVAAVTMREVSGVLGYSATAIYQHFQSKEDLLLALKLQAGDLLAEAMEQARSEPTLAEQLRAMGHAYVRFGLDNPAYYRLIFQDTESGITPTEEHLQRLRRSWTILRDTLKAWLEELGVQGVDVDQEAHILWAMGHGVTSLALAGRFSFDDREQIFALFDISAQRWGQGLIKEQPLQEHAQQKTPRQSRQRRL